MPNQEIEVHQPHHPDRAECNPRALHAVLSNARGRPLHQLNGRGLRRGGQTLDLPLPCLQVRVIGPKNINFNEMHSFLSYSGMRTNPWINGADHSTRQSG